MSFPFSSLVSYFFPSKPLIHSPFFHPKSRSISYCLSPLYHRLALQINSLSYNNYLNNAQNYLLLFHKRCRVYIFILTNTCLPLLDYYNLTSALISSPLNRHLMFELLFSQYRISNLR